MGPSFRSSKRVLDVAVSLVGLGLLAPLLPVIALAIRLESRGPVFQREPCVGAERRVRRSPSRGGRRVHDVQGRLFSRRRFRVSGEGRKHTPRYPGEPPRLTRVGRLLRRSGVEGWPQLLNVLLGQMSLVGPRPASPACVDRLARECPAWRARASHVRPGIFGLAQLDHPRQGGFFASVCEQLLFDVEYARRLRENNGTHILHEDLGLMFASLRRRFSSSRQPAGNDLIRIDYPREWKQLALDAGRMAQSTPAGLGAEVLEQGDSLVAYWYPPRHKPGPAAPVDGDVLAALSDELHGEGDDALVLSRRLVPSSRDALDVLRLELPDSLHEVHAVCEHLLILWESLMPRAEDEHFPLSMTFLVVEGLAAVAAGLEGRPGRLSLRVEVGARELRLTLARRPRDGALVGAGPVLSRVLRKAPLVMTG